MARTTVGIEMSTRDRLQWVKVMSMSRDYDSALNWLIDESDLDVPYGVPPTEENIREMASQVADG